MFAAASTVPRAAPGGQGTTARPQSFRLEASASGTLEALKLRAVARRPPAAGEVEIEVHAAGLNFSDVMKALGLYPGLGDGPVPLGLECGGNDHGGRCGRRGVSSRRPGHGLREFQLQQAPLCACRGGLPHSG